MKLNLLENYIAYCQKQFLNTISMKAMREKNYLEPLVVLKQIQLEKEFKKLLEENTAAYGGLWDILQELKPSYEKILILSQHINKGNKKIDKLWNDLCAFKTGVASNVAQIYWAYCSKVRIDTQILNQIEEILLNLRNSGSFNLLTQNCDDSCGIICISGGTKSLGKIDNGNKAISRLIGYELAELKELPVTSIMPSIFRESHNKLFQFECYLTEAGQKKEYSERESFILHKSQYIIPVDIKITEIPNVLNSYCFIGKVKLNQEKNKYNIYI